MAITQCSSGIIITGEEDTRLYQMLALRSALGLELKGMRHSKGSVYAHIKKLYGFKGSKEKVWVQLDQLIKMKTRERETKLRRAEEEEANNAG